MRNALITGSAGLIGSESAKFFVKQGFTIYGIDNDMRKYFFGMEASTKWSRENLEKELKDKYTHYAIDIRDNEKLEEVFKKTHFDLIIHTAAQPSHDWAAKEPLTDFGINALGTVNILENYRKYSPDGVFIFTSTNKVYGDNPNMLPFAELSSRYEITDNHEYYNGIDESMGIDQATHSIFGVSKIAADLMVQEYGRYFGLKTGVFRGGCLTGPAHSGAELHGFLAYLVKCSMLNIPYTVIGYNGKQVRDNIHSYDLVNAFFHFYQHPRSGEVYNMGGSRHSNISIREAMKKISKLTGKKINTTYKEQNRIGDHIWYISDVSKFMNHYPQWNYSYSIDGIIDEICRLGHFTV
jgi:CDP-paratose 2-epimerase